MFRVSEASEVEEAAGLILRQSRALLRILEERKFPVRELRLLASERSAGRTLVFRGADVEVVSPPGVRTELA